MDLEIYHCTPPTVIYISKMVFLLTESRFENKNSRIFGEHLGAIFRVMCVVIE